MRRYLPAAVRRLRLSQLVPFGRRQFLAQVDGVPFYIRFTVDGCCSAVRTREAE